MFVRTIRVNRAYSLALLLGGLPFASYAQKNIITISASSNFYLAANALVSFDSLDMLPTSALNITGANSITKESAVVNPASGPSIKRDYYLTSMITNFTGDIGIYYQTSELNGLTASTLQVNAYDAGWSNYTSVTAANVAGVIGTSNLSFSEITLGSSLTPLPVLWEALSAYRQSGYTYVQWTAQGNGVWKSFQVQKSLDGYTWSDPAAPQEARNGEGSYSYSWTDSSAPAAVSYYRIQASDGEGNYSYSTTAAVWAAGTRQLNLYPDPVTTTVNLSFGDGTPDLKSVRIYNASGQVVLSDESPGSTPYETDVGRLAPGWYVLHTLFADGSTATRAFLKQ